MRTRLEIEERITQSRQRYEDRKWEQIDGMRAGGGPVRAGKAYMVGEKGREIFVPEEDGQIIPNNVTEAALSAGSNSPSIIYVDARGATDPRAIEEAGYRGAQRAITEFTSRASQRGRM